MLTSKYAICKRDGRMLNNQFSIEYKIIDFVVFCFTLLLIAQLICFNSQIFVLNAK